MARIIPRQDAKTYTVKGEPVEVNLREDYGRLFMCIYRGDDIIAQQEYDPENPNASVSEFLTLLNGLAGTAGSLPPGAANAAKARLRKIDSNGGIFREAP